LLLRSDPSPEVDAAWEELTDVGVIIITGDEVSQLGKDPTKTVKAPKEWGLFFPALVRDII
jgi:Mycotoxin biosynthesis protein UstYa